MNYQRGFISPLLLALIALLLIGGGAYVYVQNRLANQSLVTVNTPQTSDWKTCENKQLGFRVQYPNDWAIWYPDDSQGGADRPPIELESCSDTDNGQVTLAPRWSNGQNIWANIHVCDLACMDTTIYKGVTTLDEFLAKNPFEVRDWPIMSTTTISGEKTIVLKDGSMIFFHKGLEYTLIFSSDTGKEIQQAILQTFVFTK